jgi:hypothetical protein
MLPRPASWIRVLALCALLISTTSGFAAGEPVDATELKPAADTTNARKGTVIADLDNDGDVDIFVTSLYESRPREPQPFGEYWIGIDGVSPDDALRAQLELPAGQGIMINQVVEDSPASKAGLKQYDVLLACQDKPLAEIADLAKIIEEKKETLLTLRLIRGGKRIMIEITPQKRPASQTGDTCPAVSKADDANFVRRVWLDLQGRLPDPDDIQRFIASKQEKKREWLTNRLLRSSTATNKSCTLCHASQRDEWMARRDILWWNADAVKLKNGDYHTYVKRLVGLPGAFIDQGDGTFVDVGQKLPDDVSITVTVKGSEAAKITVKKGDQAWEGSGADFAAKLPDEIRGHVAAFFGAVPAPSGAPRLWATDDPHGRWDLLLKGRLDWCGDGWHNVLLQDPTNVNVQSPAPETAFDRLDKQIDSLGTQLGELRKAMHDLQQSLKTTKNNPGTPEK